MNQETLFREIQNARSRVYAVAPPTPLEELPLPIDAEVYLKREDLSPVNSYKWRGAYNRMCLLTPEEKKSGVIAASAGNHAQGVALAAKRMGVPAKIYMPLSTPRTKQAAVKKHGEDMVEVVLTGDNYSEAAAEALRVAKEEKLTFIHPYDDLHTMAGQGTLGDEAVISGKGPFDLAYLQIGGGGMAAAVATVLRFYYPDIKIIGVEGKNQASMKAAIDKGEPVELPHVDVFCDGTAVKKAGALTYPICSRVIDEFMTVSNEEVCGAIQSLWETSRCLAEPSGAMGVAALLKDAERARGKRVLTVLCGANLDFGQLSWIVRHAGIGSRRRRYYRFEVEERPGALMKLLDTLMSELNIIEFQYGKIHEERAWYVVGLEASPPEFGLLEKKAAEFGYDIEDVTSQEDVEFRIIHYRSELFNLPFFIRLEFPERPGALRDFLIAMKSKANICYFNYIYTGERVGRALLGFEFEDQNQREEFIELLEKQSYNFFEVSEKALGRIL